MLTRRPCCPTAAYWWPGDGNTSNSGYLGNISTRGLVQTGDNVLIGGFIVTGTQPKKVLVRAIGPTLNLAGQTGESYT